MPGHCFSSPAPILNLRTVTDVRGRRLVVGPQQSGMAQHARVILGTLGLTFSDFTPMYLDFAAGAEALERGEADAQLQCPIPNKVMTALAARVLLRVVPYASADLDTVLRAVPFYRRTVMRQGAIRGLDADVAQAAVVNVLVTHARTPEDTVRDVASAIFNARERAAAIERPVRRHRGTVRAAAVGRRQCIGVRRCDASSRRDRCLSSGGIIAITATIARRVPLPLVGRG